MSPTTDFPRTDLAPLRHQQVRGLLVREARTATGRRVPRRVVPVVAGLSVVGAVALPATGLGGALGSAVSSFTNPCPPSTGDGYRPEYRRPKASDDTASVRFLPPGTPSEVTFRMESDCPLPERADRPVMRPDAVWTLARTGADGRIDAVVTLYRGLPEGISPQVADRTSLRLPTDGNDPGTVLDPPYEPAAVRGTTGTLAERPLATRSVPTSLIWAEPSHGMWSLQAFGLTSPEVVAIADRLRVRGDALEPGERRVFRPSDVFAGELATPFWYRLDVPARPEVAVSEVSWSAYLFARTAGRTAGTSLFTEIHGPAPDWDDWRVQVQPGDQIVDVDGREALLSAASFGSLMFDLPGGALVRMSLRDAGMTQLTTPAAVEELQTTASALAAVPANDPRLVHAAVEE
jgi:hypothetical protein